MPGQEIFFLNIPVRPGGNVTVTDSPRSENLSPGNRFQLSDPRYRGILQADRNVAYVNPTKEAAMIAIVKLLKSVVGLDRPPIGRHCANSFWIAALLVSFLFSLALAETKSAIPGETKPAAPKNQVVPKNQTTPKSQAAAKSQGSCPSQEFSKFIEVFLESVVVQRKFTRFPLEYRYIDARLIGGAPDDEIEKKQFIKSFDQIPFRSRTNPKEIWLIANSRERKKFRWVMEIDPPEPDENEKEVALKTPDTGDITYYYFRRYRDCWYLFVVDNKST